MDQRGNLAANVKGKKKKKDDVFLKDLFGDIITDDKAGGGQDGSDPGSENSDGDLGGG